MARVEVRHPNFEGLVVEVDTDMDMPDFDGANCAGLPTEAFFYSWNSSDENPWAEQHKYRQHEEYSGTADQTHFNRLVRICETCPALLECFEWAMVSEEYGWWGGSSARQRRQRRIEAGITLSDISAFNDEAILAMRLEAVESILEDTHE